MIALGFFALAIMFYRVGGLVSHATDIAIAVVGLSAIAIAGLWLLTLPWTAKYRACSRWFRDVSVSAGIAALVSSGTYALLLSRSPSFSHVRLYELRTLACFASGMWMGLLLSLLGSVEFWEPRQPSTWRTQMLRKRQV